MTPDAAENLGDEMWAAMVRHMQAEARAIEAANAKIPRR